MIVTRLPLLLTIDRVESFLEPLHVLFWSVLTHVEHHDLLHSRVVERLLHLGESFHVKGLALECFLVLNPWVGESLVGGESLVNILDDEALQELLRLWCVLLERLVVEMEVTFDDVADNFEF